MDESSAPTSKSPLVLYFCIALGALVLVVGFLVAAQVTSRSKVIAGWQDLPKEISAARALGLPTNAAELTQMQGRVPDEQNAALVFEPPDGSRLKRIPYAELPPVRAMLQGNAASASEAARVLSQHAEEIAVYERAADMERAVYKRDWNDGLLASLIQNYQEVREATTLLGGRAVLNAKRGGFDEAFEDLRRVRNLARHQLSFPSALASETASLCEKDGLDAATQILKLAPNSAPVKAALAEVYAEPLKPDWRLIIGGELVTTVATSRLTPKMIEGKEFDKSTPLDRYSSDEKFQAKVQAELIRYWRHVFLELQERQTYADLVVALDAIASKNKRTPPHSELESVVSDIQPPTGIYRAEASRRLLLLALGNRTLREDPFDGKPLRTKGKRYWSVGHNGVDDGGSRRHDVVVDLGP